MRSASAVVSVGGLIATLATPVAAQPEALSFPEAIELALRRTPEVAGAAASVAAAEFRTAATAALRFPQAHAEANLLRWNEPLLVSFAPMPGMAAAEPFVARDRHTTQVALSLIQPIAGLFVLGRQLAIERSGVERARADLAGSKLDAAQRAASAYLNVLMAMAIEDVADKALAQMEQRRATAEKQQAAGVLNRVDVLRLKSARDSATLDLVRAKSDVAVARSQLALAVNRAADDLPAVVDDFPDPPPPVELSEAELARKAAAQRPDLRGAREQAKQAQLGRAVAKSEWLPSVSAVGTYQHITGQGPFQPRNAWYVGATLSWDVWLGGRTHKNVREAEARATQAELLAQALRNQIVTEVRQRLLETKAAFASLTPARTALEAASEAHRIQTLRFEEGLANTTDMIDAETDLTRARSAYAQARYRFYLAEAALARAAGALPLQRAR